MYSLIHAQSRLDISEINLSHKVVEEWGYLIAIIARVRSIYESVAWTIHDSHESRAREENYCPSGAIN